MAVRAQDIQFYLSGGATNTKPDASLGGVISTQDVVAEALLRNLFDDVSSGEATAGDTEYRCYYVKNISASTWFGAEVWVQVNTPSAGTTIDIGLDPAGVGGTATTVADEGTAPAGVAFSAPTGSPGLSIGNMTAGQHQAVWVRRTVTAGVAAAPADDVTLRHSGSDV